MKLKLVVEGDHGGMTCSVIEFGAVMHNGNLVKEIKDIETFAREKLIGRTLRDADGTTVGTITNVFHVE